MITIRKPEIFEHNGKVRIQNIIDIETGNGKESKNLYFDIGPEFAQYLCPERSDAYVIGLLNYAMRNKHDITCEVPMTERLYYQITTYLIPTLSNHSKVLHPTAILTALERESIANAGAVGTGMSCGVDSLHVMAAQYAAQESGHSKESGDQYLPNGEPIVTHLVHANVGAHGIGERARILYPGVEANASNFANEAGLPIINIDSNWAEFIWDGYLTQAWMHPYSNCMVVYLLQKLWNTWLYASSGVAFSEFNVINTEERKPCRHELLLFDCFSTDRLKIYTEGGTKTRLQKMQTVVNYPLSKKYLNVCWLTSSNCSRCAKCSYTLVILDALNQLDEFSSVFDIAYYKANRWRYYTRLYSDKLLGDSYMQDVYVALRRRINVFHRLLGFGRCIGQRFWEIFQWRICTRIPSLSRWFNKKAQEWSDRKAGVDSTRES